jgi:hypothetical protein
VDRLDRLTRKTDCCWLWLGGIDGGGYGLIRVDGRLTKAHRVSYELHVGPIPDGMHMDHLCRVRLCVRPDHLEPVTNKENTARGIGPSGDAAKAARTHCPQGHPYDEVHIDRGARFCRRCKNDYSNRWYARRRQAAKESA